MIYNKLFAIILPLAVVGCTSSVEDARLNQPSWQGSSSKSTEALSQCIYSGWSTSRVIAKDDTSHTEMKPGKTTVYTWEESMFVDLTPQGSGTDMRFYKTFEMGETVLADRLSIVQHCR